MINAIKRIAIKELRDFIFNNYYRQIGFAKENSYYSMERQRKKDLLSFASKLIEKIPDPSNTKVLLIISELIEERI